jgi:antitoxin VapB
MSINIKNPEAERLLNALARRMGKGKTEVVLELLRDEAARQARLASIDERRAKIKALVRRAAAKAKHRNKTHEEIIGYDENGLPT